MVAITLHDYDPEWPRRFDEVAEELTSALGATARSVDHFGSTAIPGLAAKPVIDVMVRVDDVDTTHPGVRAALTPLGYVWQEDNLDHRKRFYLRPVPFRVHLHVRRHDCFSASSALLFRDYLRAEESARVRYESTKRELAARGDVWRDGSHYADAKGDSVWQLLREADRWAWSGEQPKG